MNEKKDLLLTIGICFVISIICGVTGYCIGRSYGSADVARLTAEYDAAKRERDAAVNGIAENNRLLREGAVRAQFELDAATGRVAELEEHIRSAGIRNQSVITTIGESRQNLEEASRIIEHYLGKKQADENNSDSGDSGCRGSGDINWLPGE